MNSFPKSWIVKYVIFHFDDDDDDDDDDWYATKYYAQINYLELDDV